ncbi:MULTISPECIES: hypothetical protein [unclassified Plantactinospora]|uniref:hypothetical protein n=1 Tax=unclassified Plantactinospora TaxID=2631981 RepID=UPI000D1725D7|nr:MULTISPECIES: hypothetical protein [unclassified Plantactinospora]AVT28562.1 hypothetical protein C6361_02550 [Plantactinospora sp. BC1]AVT38201.1 hypothetical protein C6W10_19110 [Plantactinospora sp. BB1]
MDGELFPERVAWRPGPVITGHVVRLMEGYSREVRIGQPVLVAVLGTAAVVKVVLLLIASVLRAGAGAGARRKWKDLRKGPEFLVTPLRVRDGSGVLCEMEIHGHLPQSALEPADHIQVTVRSQKDAGLAPRVERIVNLTTGQLLTPRTPTLWSHLGPALLLQAAIGLLLIGALVAWLALAR